MAAAVGFVTKHEAFGVITVVGEAWELAEPVRGNQAERVPTPTPGVPDPAAIENQVIPAGPLQIPANRK